MNEELGKENFKPRELNRGVRRVTEECIVLYWCSLAEQEARLVYL